MGQLSPLDGSTRCVLAGTTNNPTMYAAEWLAAIPYPFRVLGGDELREAATRVGQRMLEAVNNPSPTPGTRHSTS